MNKIHLEFCSSDEWAETIRKYIVPWTVEGIDLGEDVLEIGPGPGRTTELIVALVPKLTALEIDADLAQALRARLPGVDVVLGDGTRMQFEDGRFSAALSFTMLHHVPTPEMQDALLAEAARVLRPGGVFAGVDSFDSEEFRQNHIGDICVPVPPETLRDRLLRAGFSQAKVDTNPYQLRFQAVR